MKGLFVLSAAMMLGACSSKKEEKTETETSSVKVVQPAENKDAGPTGSVEGGKKYSADINIKDYGTVKVELDEGIAPRTVQNFVKLANEGFYNGLTFHRIIDGFMIQGGDPEGTGAGGSDETVYGEFSSNGFNNTLSHKEGVISMARSQDPNSASSQFFIVESDSTFLDGQYAGFGHVTEGMDIVHKIAEDAKPTDDNGTIKKDEQPVIESITITELQ